MEVTGTALAVTVILQASDRFPWEAATVAVPTATPFTLPSLSTETIAGFEVAQEIVLSVALEGLTVATKRLVSPSFRVSS